MTTKIDKTKHGAYTGRYFWLRVNDEWEGSAHWIQVLYQERHCYPFQRFNRLSEALYTLDEAKALHDAVTRTGLPCTIVTGRCSFDILGAPGKAPEFVEVETNG